MSLITALGSRPFQALSPRPDWQEGVGAQAASASGQSPAPMPVVEPVAQASGNVKLSQQALNARLADLGDKTVDAAQNLIGSFAQSLFGDAAKGATFSFDAISISADTSLSSRITHASSAGATFDSAAIRFNESASFVGTGKIVTSDGQSYDFTVEVNYEASASANVEQAAVPDSVNLTGKQLPPVEYPGSLSDLFKVLGRQLDVKTDSGNDAEGKLSLRLIRLVNSAALLAPKVRADAPEATPAERNRALASYAPPADSTTVATA